MEKLINRGLPKWPCLLVVGKPVSTDAAKEIIIRTDGLFFSTNDRTFERHANFLIYGVEAESYNLTTELLKKLNTSNYSKVYDYENKQRAKYGTIDLTYLNNRRIVSSYIGGPHGWCDWDGNIGCNTYNIGKWPSIKEVRDDWAAIAKTFPFLDLRSQLLDKEQCEQPQGNPVVEFVVKNGKVRVVEPKSLLIQPQDNTIDNAFSLFKPGRERGCTILQLAEALDYVRVKMEKESIKKNAKV